MTYIVQHNPTTRPADAHWPEWVDYAECDTIEHAHYHYMQCQKDNDDPADRVRIIKVISVKLVEAQSDDN